MTKFYKICCTRQPRVSMMALCTLEFGKRVALMLSVHTTKQTKHKTKGMQGNFESCSYVYSLACGDDISGVCLCPNSSNYTY